MRKFTIILPTHYNDGLIVETYKTENALQSIMDISGGYSMQIIEGCYRMADGTAKREESRMIWSVAGYTLQHKLENLCKQFAKLFNQECIYFSVEDINVQFIGRN